MKIQVLFFGITTDLTGTNAIHFEMDEPIAVVDFKQSLQSKFPRLTELDSYAIAVNETYASEATIIIENDVVAVIPPVSGG